MPVLKEVAAPITTPAPERGQNVTLIGAMALTGLVGEKTIPGATDALAFKTYVTQVLVPNLWTGAMGGSWIICLVIKSLEFEKPLKKKEQPLFTCLPIRQIFHRLKTVGQRLKSFSAKERHELMLS